MTPAFFTAPRRCNGSLVDTEWSPVADAIDPGAALFVTSDVETDIFAVVERIVPNS